MAKKIARLSTLAERINAAHAEAYGHAKTAFVDAVNSIK